MQKFRALRNFVCTRLGAEDGDVPGWVMVTLMTAGLVVALSAVALPALTNLFNDAITHVSAL
ncbi:hypothetical protein [Mobiluncus curtisii]|uniref:Uncharacterized protein n=1 Tax=Mobiluncus curtisii TaxID=2051 RepID=A0A7Y0UG82_9ACTO|nr:hypothetical protein [Mobiluncus curtisii]EFL92959.1 hypothetical protein HMPREF0574_1560 [Mobiluncus curtisii subsp. curtisii ATCC 35241]MCU9987030.1 hypothetical protein [Mobiluncus curtisii]MCU9999930.1 hypothetical protein [Mobiluncus curtisii]MCV0020420.1 hypothetical protein [Mobiluncus curtisii]NMW44344.1 hypothetical protein [Mobiluncus curtisii]